MQSPRAFQIQLHSANPGDAWNFRAGIPQAVLWCDSKNQKAYLIQAEKVSQEWADPLAALEWMAKSISPNQRWIGFLSYDLGRLFEAHAPGPTDDLALPLFVFTLHNTDGKQTDAARPWATSNTALHSNFTRPAYESTVARAVDYIRAGDVFQVNLAQRFTAGLTMQPDQIWTNLLPQSPAPYGAYLNYGDFALLCNSPELFLHVTPNRRVITRPIKGTRPRLPGMDIELLHSEKDKAELNMIVDLERNDLGRVCRLGSVKVTQPRTIETHPTVYHGAASIEGILREEITFVDLVRATFPGGSITGAPKIRAMQIIDELEPVRRGPYCGAVGYIAGDGSMQFNVAIRTMIIQDRLVHIPVGGGIVADSDPTAEYDETLVKAKAMFNALGISKS
jgi:para-aminobenzoate synthetase component 1